MKDNTVKIFGCSVGTGSGGTLALTDPKSRNPLTQTALSSSSSSSTSSSAAPTQTTGGSDNDNGDKGDDNKSKGAPIGAIVGGVVGGIGAIALVAIGILLFLRRKNHNQPDETNDQTPAQKDSPQGQSASPSHGYEPQTTEHGYYTPNTAVAYQQQQYPSQEYHGQGYSPVPRNESEFAPPHQWNSPTPVSSVLAGHQSTGSEHQVVGELPAVNPAGSPENRAELG